MTLVRDLSTVGTVFTKKDGTKILKGFVLCVAFVVSPDTVWNARVLLLFSASAATDTGPKSFERTLVSTWTLETYNDPENGKYIMETYNDPENGKYIIISLIFVMCIIRIKLIKTFQVS
jgi:hypothetical protein